VWELGTFLVLLVGGYITGRIAETRHYRSILEREEASRTLLLVASRHLPDGTQGDTTLVTGSVVISVDYFKRFLASLRSFFGGRVGSYETLLDRARREAILRTKHKARDHGAQMVFNIKLETSSISRGARDTVGSVEVLAYGTALTLSRGA